MSPSTIIALIRDTVLLTAVGFILWFVYHAGTTADAISDMKGQLKQVQDAQKQTAQWQKEQSDATTQAGKTLAAFTDLLNKRPPVIVRIPAMQTAPSAAAAGSTGGQNSEPGRSGQACSADVRSIDIRPVLAGVEEPIVQSLIYCQQLHDSWPR